jgi:hypothetical protein
MILLALLSTANAANNTVFGTIWEIRPPVCSDHLLLIPHVKLWSDDPTAAAIARTQGLPVSPMASFEDDLTTVGAALIVGGYTLLNRSAEDGHLTFSYGAEETGVVVSLDLVANAEATTITGALTLTHGKRC